MSLISPHRSPISWFTPLVVILFLSFFARAGGGNYPLGLALRAFGRPVVAHVTHIYPHPNTTELSVQYEAEKDYWPTVTVRAGADAVRSVKEGDKVPAHAFGGRNGFVRLDEDFGFSRVEFLTAAAFIILVTLVTYSKLLFSREPTHNDRPALSLPVSLSKAADRAAVLGGVIGVKMILLSQPVARTLLPFAFVAAWAALRLARWRGTIEFIEVLPPGKPPPELALPTNETARQPLRPKGKDLAKATIWPVRTPEGWSVLPAVPLAVGSTALALGALLRAYGRPLAAAWDVLGFVLIGLAAVMGLLEFRRAWTQATEARSQ